MAVLNTAAMQQGLVEPCLPRSNVEVSALADDIRCGTQAVMLFLAI